MSRYIVDGIERPELNYSVMYTGDTQRNTHVKETSKPREATTRGFPSENEIKIIISDTEITTSNPDLVSITRDGSNIVATFDTYKVILNTSTHYLTQYRNGTSFMCAPAMKGNKKMCITLSEMFGNTCTSVSYI
jgi:hypothetical protein